MNRTMKLSAAAGMLAAFAVASTINDYLPTRENVLAAPFVKTASVGEDVALRTGSVRVENIAVAKQVLAKGTQATTPGMFLTFTLTYVPNGTEPVIGPVEIVGGNDKVFGGTQAAGRILTCGGSQAGLPITCDMAIEVAPDAVAGAHIRVFNRASMSGDDHALIDAGLDEDAVKNLMQQAGSFHIQAPRYGETR